MDYDAGIQTGSCTGPAGDPSKKYPDPNVIWQVRSYYPMGEGGDISRWAGPQWRTGYSEYRTSAATVTKPGYAAGVGEGITGRVPIFTASNTCSFPRSYPCSSLPYMGR